MSTRGIIITAITVLCLTYIASLFFAIQLINLVVMSVLGVAQ